jgi:large subunit ribosomal protein L20
MPRVKRGTVRRAKRKRLLSRAKGYFLTKSKLYRSAQQAVDKALGYAFVGRRDKKRDFRRLWIVRINAAAHENSFTYRELIQGMKLACIEIDRKQLAEMAVADAPAFTVIVDKARKAVEDAKAAKAAEQAKAGR